MIIINKFKYIFFEYEIIKFIKLLNLEKINNRKNKNFQI